MLEKKLRCWSYRFREWLLCTLGKTLTCKLCGTHSEEYWGGYGPDETGLCYSCWDMNHWADR